MQRSAQKCTMVEGLDLSSLPFTHARKILVVAPHPDDETLGCGGLVSLLAQNGSAFYIVFVTDGSASHRNSTAWPTARLAAQREQEARNALVCLGIAKCITPVSPVAGCQYARSRNSGLGQCRSGGKRDLATLRARSCPLAVAARSTLRSPSLMAAFAARAAPSVCASRHAGIRNLAGRTWRR